MSLADDIAADMRYANERKLITMGLAEDTGDRYFAGQATAWVEAETMFSVLLKEAENA